MQPTDPPSCDDCSMFTKGEEFDRSMGSCSLKGCYISTQHWAILRTCGCLSHPRAREWLLKPVIDVLEDRYERDYDPSPSNRTDDGGMYNQDELNMLEWVINVVRGSDMK